MSFGIQAKSIFVMVSEQTPYTSADLDSYRRSVEDLRPRYLTYPRVVSIEPQVICNASCRFCPYPNSPRKGQKLPESLFYKIINDLEDIPVEHEFLITLARLTEPLLDNRLQSFSCHIAEKLPQAIHQFWSNGLSLTRGKFEWMSDFPRAYLNISLNSVNEEEHRQMMGVGLERIMHNLDYLHTLVLSGKFQVPVTLSAPYIDASQARAFTQACKKRWPQFLSAVRPFFIWQGGSASGSSELANYKISNPVQRSMGSLPCGQWFDLPILASGFYTMCCVNETGFDGVKEYDVRNNHVLALYESNLDLRTKLPKREQMSTCRKCLHLG